MLVVKPWISVESSPGPTCQTLIGVPGFSFSRTIGFGLLGAVAVRAVAVAGAKAGAAVMGAVVAGVTAFAAALNGRLTLFGVFG
jgi:hypothetical protein